MPQATLKFSATVLWAGVAGAAWLALSVGQAPDDRRLGRRPELTDIPRMTYETRVIPRALKPNFTIGMDWREL